MSELVCELIINLDSFARGQRSPTYLGEIYYTPLSVQVCQAFSSMLNPPNSPPKSPPFCR